MLPLLVYLFVKETLPSKEKIEGSYQLENNYEKAEKGNLWQVLLKRRGNNFNLLTLEVFL
jgi:hypothetical protein